MKSKITFLSLIVFSAFATAQNSDKTYDLLKDKTQTKILYDRVFGISNATEINKNAVDASYFKQVYHEIQRADYLQRLPKFDYIKEQANLGFAQNQIPISILISEFENIKPASVVNKSIYLNANNEYEVKPLASVFEKHNLSIIAPLLSKSKSNSVDFILKDNLVFNTTNKTIISVKADFGNGKGFQVLEINQVLKITFPESGNQKIVFKIELSDGQIINENAIFETEISANTIAGKSNAMAPNVVSTIESTIPYQGYGETAAFLGQGEYEVFLDNVNGVLDKPIFLLDGFDPGDTRNVASIYTLLNYGTGQNLADDLRAQGFDIVILNFPTYTRPTTTTVIDGGVDYIQRNAMILVELINQINAQKVGTQKNVVVGPSMGGLISRYALRYMETHSMNPDTRLYISFDSPHLGANVPIGMQHLFNYMAYGPLGNTAVQTLVDGLLKSSAGREMLIDQFEGHLQTGSAFEFNTGAATLLPTGCPNYRDAFQAELNAMGFPTTTRNVSIANGAGNGAMNGTPDMVVMDHTFNVTTSQRAIINLRFTPLANATNQVSRFRGQQLFLGFWITGYESLANSKSPTYTSGLDSAPGGKFDISALAAGAGTNALLTEFFNNLLIQYFDFIPTNSSMAISSTTNLYAPVTSSSVTPFLASSIPTINENHITLNPQNVVFALNEILNPVLTTQNNTFGNLFVQNPINNHIEINSLSPITNAEVIISDVMGKVILSKTNQNIEGNYQIPITLSSGMYLLEIKNASGNIVKKLIKE
jgi:pimeloyl-ACP methyl ester carboxylesterase